MTLSHRRFSLTVITLFAVIAATAANPNALVRIAVGSLRSQPMHSAELETQATLGTPVFIDSITDNGEWGRATLPDDYRAWIPLSSVTLTDSLEMSRWQQSHRLICISPQQQLILAAPSDSAAIVSDITLGSIVEGTLSPDYSEVTLPDGRCGFVASPAMASLKEWLEREPTSHDVLNTVRALMGVSYLWGGRSTKAIDCSGLTQLAFANAGLMLPRNASAQADIGTAISPDTAALAPADLLFFQSDAGRVNHVAIHEADGRYIHSSGLVHRSAMLPSDSLYNHRVVTSARRILGNPQIKKLRNHPWYFNDNGSRFH